MTKYNIEEFKRYSDSQLAKKYNVSRQNMHIIRLRLLSELDCIPKSRDVTRKQKDDEKNKQKEIKEAEKIKRKQKQLEEIKKYSELWNTGIPYKEISKKTNLTLGSAAQKVIRLRKSHPELFPKRQPFGR
jgi:hypothetical protein